MNRVFQENESDLEFIGIEPFDGALTDLIWLRLIIEDAIVEKYGSLIELTAL